MKRKWRKLLAVDPVVSVGQILRRQLDPLLLAWDAEPWSTQAPVLEPQSKPMPGRKDSWLLYQVP